MSQEVLTKTIKQLMEICKFTKTSKITLHDHFTQLIYAVRHFLYALSTLGFTVVLCDNQNMR